jgi:hypothetical protein
MAEWMLLAHSVTVNCVDHFTCSTTVLVMSRHLLSENVCTRHLTCRHHLSIAARVLPLGLWERSFPIQALVDAWHLQNRPSSLVLICMMNHVLSVCHIYSEPSRGFKPGWTLRLCHHHLPVRMGVQHEENTPIQLVIRGLV